MIPGKYRSVSGRAANNVNCGLHLVIQTSSLPEKNKVELRLNKETASFSGRLLQHDLERNYSSRQGIIRDGRVISPSPRNKSSCISSTTNVTELYGLDMKTAMSSFSAFGDSSIQIPSKSRIRQGCHSAGPNVPGDHINLVSSSMPSFPILQRSSEEKILYSDRLTLERIKKISNLENLKNLDVLDLHGNQITKIENVNHLCDLRVLNLARNLLSHVDNLNGLNSLTELNLRHNQITSVRDVDNLPCLQRLFLSFNNIANFESVCCLADSTSLSDITFDGNPIAQESWYKHTVLQNMQQLRQLDMKRVTEEERRMASVVAKKEEEKKRESHKQSLLKEKKRLTINNIARQWDLQQHRVPNIATSQDRKDSDSPSQDPCQMDRSTISAFPEETGSLDSVLTSALQGLSATDTHLVDVDGDTLSLYGSGALECLDRNWSVQTAGMVTTVSFTFIEFDEIVQVLPKLKMKFPNSLHLKFKETNLVMLQQFNALAQLRRIDQLTIDPQGNPVVNFTLWKYYVLFRLSHFSIQKINGTEVTQNDMIMAERLFGILAHVTSSELPQYRMISILGDARKKQFRYLQETKGKKPGVVNEENNDSKRLVGENTNRAMLNYTTRDFYNEKLEETKGKKKFCNMYIEDLVKEATEINTKNEALQKLWPQMFIELVRDAVIETRNKNSYMKLCLQQITDQK
ncbi:leucine-rich repeat-containing protein 49 isoform X6 [Phyllostomus discolor]|uniref:Leucine-rich repeat-containing protein 49 isoform X6 n=1 Tax=Phyllostomus discolor TaxID=89673 RepID=A0A7E6DZ16_9CHIR|nr:leucine-rich repeat-containing protein 49 isoform X6 [Phyllostomus discolor]